MTRANDPAYASWKSMRQRCANPKAAGYRFYGGRGIKVCARWLNSYDNFLADMGPRPDGTTIDRFPNQNGDYEPGNCRWATKIQQTENQRRRSENLVMRMPENLMDKRFGRLTVTGYQGIRNHKAQWFCQCLCGRKKIVGAAALKRGRTRSCGCLRKDVAIFNLPEVRA